MSRRAIVSEEPHESDARRPGACQAKQTGAKAASHVWFWALVAAGVVLDLVTKIAAFAIWDPGVRRLTGPAVIPGLLYITTRYNPAGAWGFFGGWPWPLFALVQAAIAGCVGYYRHKAIVRAARRLFDLSMGLILAGAAGNLLDRLFTSTHEVRDFIDVWFGNWSYPVFNLADVFIVAGVIGYVWWGWRIEGRVEAASEEPGEATGAAGSAERD